MHLQNSTMCRERGNEPCFQLWWPACREDSHAMNFYSSSSAGVFISLAHLVCQHADESPIGGMGVHAVWAGCLGMLEGLIFISNPSRYQEFACNLMMDIMNTNRKWSGKSEWEWWKGEETVTGKTPHKSALLWIYGGQISGFWTLNWELAHLRTSNTCMLQCSSHVSMSCKNKSGVNTRDSQLSCFDSVQGL